MARVKVEEVLDYLSFQLKRALAEALEKQGQEVDGERLYRDFANAARYKCGTWEYVPDAAVETEDDPE